MKDISVVVAMGTVRLGGNRRFAGWEDSSSMGFVGWIVEKPMLQ